MRDIFAALYETVFGIYDSQFSLIFNTLYDDGGYVKLGLTLFLAPLFLWSLFYYAWKNPYGKFLHWFVWLVISFLIVGGVTWGIANNEIFVSNNQALIDAIDDPNSGYKQFAQTLPLNYTWVNGALTLILGFVYSIILKRWSKIQIHLPF